MQIFFLIFHYLLFQWGANPILMQLCKCDTVQNSKHDFACHLYPLYCVSQLNFSNKTSPLMMHQHGSILPHSWQFMVRGRHRTAEDFVSLMKLGGRSAKLTTLKACISIYLFLKITFPSSREFLIGCNSDKIWIFDKMQK